MGALLLNFIMCICEPPTLEQLSHRDQTPQMRTHGCDQHCRRCNLPSPDQHSHLRLSFSQMWTPMCDKLSAAMTCPGLSSLRLCVVITILSHICTNHRRCGASDTYNTSNLNMIQTGLKPLRNSTEPPGIPSNHANKSVYLIQTYPKAWNIKNNNKSKNWRLIPCHNFQTSQHCQMCLNNT